MGYRVYMTLREERRDKGLCIKCGAPASPDIRINVNARKAFSQGRMHWEGKPDSPLPTAYGRMHMKGWTFERLSTHAHCGPCGHALYVKKHMCTQCKKNKRATGMKRCWECLEKQRAWKASRRAQLQDGAIDVLPRPGLSRSREAAAAVLAKKMEQKDLANLAFIQVMRGKGWGYGRIAATLGWSKMQAARFCRRNNL